MSQQNNLVRADNNTDVPLALRAPFRTTLPSATQMVSSRGVHRLANAIVQRHVQPSVIKPLRSLVSPLTPGHMGNYPETTDLPLRGVMDPHGESLPFQPLATDQHDPNLDNAQEGNPFARSATSPATELAGGEQTAVRSAVTDHTETVQRQPLAAKPLPEDFTGFTEDLPSYTAEIRRRIHRAAIARAGGAAQAVADDVGGHAGGDQQTPDDVRDAATPFSVAAEIRRRIQQRATLNRATASTTPEMPQSADEPLHAQPKISVPDEQVRHTRMDETADAGSQSDVADPADLATFPHSSAATELRNQVRQARRGDRELLQRKRRAFSQVEVLSTRHSSTTDYPAAQPELPPTPPAASSNIGSEPIREAQQEQAAQPEPPDGLEVPQHHDSADQSRQQAHTETSSSSQTILRDADHTSGNADMHSPEQIVRAERNAPATLQRTAIEGGEMDRADANAGPTLNAPLVSDDTAEARMDATSVSSDTGTQASSSAATTVVQLREDNAQPSTQTPQLRPQSETSAAQTSAMPSATRSSTAQTAVSHFTPDAMAVTEHPASTVQRRPLLDTTDEVQRASVAQQENASDMGVQASTSPNVEIESTNQGDSPEHTRIADNQHVVRDDEIVHDAGDSPSIMHTPLLDTQEFAEHQLSDQGANIQAQHDLQTSQPHVNREHSVEQQPLLQTSREEDISPPATLRAPLSDSETFADNTFGDTVSTDATSHLTTQMPSHSEAESNSTVPSVQQPLRAATSESTTVRSTVQPATVQPATVQPNIALQRQPLQEEQATALSLSHSRPRLSLPLSQRQATILPQLQPQRATHEIDAGIAQPSVAPPTTAFSPLSEPFRSSRQMEHVRTTPAPVQRSTGKADAEPHQVTSDGIRDASSVPLHHRQNDEAESGRRHTFEASDGVPDRAPMSLPFGAPMRDGNGAIPRQFSPATLELAMPAPESVVTIQRAPIMSTLPTSPTTGNDQSGDADESSSPELIDLSVTPEERAATESNPSKFDLNALARQILPILKRMIAVDRERMP